MESGGAKSSYRPGSPDCQVHKVTVYNLISKGTIEEKILEMQKNKQQLADNILGSDQVNSSNLSKEDLLGLL